MRLKYNIDTQLVFQIGDPMERGCATYLHNAMYDYANINAVCLTATVKKGELPAFIRSAKYLKANGFDITMPHKTDIIQYLDECDPASKVFNCVNHVKIVEDKLVGIGLDGVGMGLAIAHGAGRILQDEHLLIIGAGAVAGPIAADLCTRGIKRVTVVNRTAEKAQYIAETLAQLYGVEVAYGPLDEAYLAGVAPDTTLAVQCTSMGYDGAQDFDSLDFVSKFPKHCIAADVLYPNTTFLDEAKKYGLRTINGEGMLFQQQIAMMEFRFGVKLDAKTLKEAEESVAIAVAMRSIREKYLQP